MHVYELGIHDVHINCVFEDVFKEGDDKRFEEQLELLADEIIDKGYYKSYTCSFFDESDEGRAARAVADRGQGFPGALVPLCRNKGICCLGRDSRCHSLHSVSGDRGWPRRRWGMCRPL